MSELITKNMPEPDTVGPYIVSGDDIDSKIILSDGDRELGGYPWAILPEDATYSWEELRKTFDGCIIESLAEHDKRIRREALTLSSEESDIGSDAIADFFASPGDEVMFEIPTRDMLDAAIEAISESRECES